MQIKPMAAILATAGVFWLLSMAWLTGYRQGYDEGATETWNAANTRTVPLPAGLVSFEDDPVELTGR